MNFHLVFTAALASSQLILCRRARHSVPVRNTGERGL